MSRRTSLTLAVPVIVAGALLLSACGEQTPGGMPAEGQQVGQVAAGSEQTVDAAVAPAEDDGAAAVESSTTAKDTHAAGAGSDADDPIVVKIGEDEFATNMAIYRRYDAAKGSPLALRAPVAPAEELDGGKKQDYVAGAIFWSPETGAQIARGQILATYLENGGPAGKLGWPVSDEKVEGDVILSDFQHGQIRLENESIRVVENAG